LDLLHTSKTSVLFGLPGGISCATVYELKALDINQKFHWGIWNYYCRPRIWRVFGVCMPQALKYVKMILGSGSNSCLIMQLSDLYTQTKVLLRNKPLNIAKSGEY
jgi:hypothetical protein